MAGATIQDGIDVMKETLLILDNVDADADKQINKVNDLLAIIANGGAVTAEQVQEVLDLANRMKSRASGTDAKVS